MKRLTRKSMAVAAVLLVLAIVAGSAAYGYFTSGRTIQNNEASTGSIILTVNNDGAALPITLPGLMPGDAGSAGDYLIKNVGTVPGTMWVGVRGNDNGVDKFFNEPLAQALLVTFWLDADQSGTWTAGDKYFVPNAHYVDYQTGDGLAVPAAAYKSLFLWNGGWSNSLDVPGASTAGLLKMAYSLPASVEDLALMNKKCNFDLMVELHQYHPDMNTITLLNVGSHSGATWTAVSDGVIVSTGTVGGNGYSFDLPVDVYDIEFAKDSWTWTKHIDITIVDQAFDLPA